MCLNGSWCFSSQEPLQDIWSKLKEIKGGDEMFEDWKNKFIQLVEDMPEKHWKRFVKFEDGQFMSRSNIYELAEYVENQLDDAIPDEVFEQMIQDEEINQIVKNAIEGIVDHFNDELFCP